MRIESWRRDKRVGEGAGREMKRTRIQSQNHSTELYFAVRALTT